MMLSDALIRDFVKLADIEIHIIVTNTDNRSDIYVYQNSR